MIRVVAFSTWRLRPRSITLFGQRVTVFLNAVRVLGALIGFGIASSAWVFPQEATEDRVKGSGWWPTKSVPSRADYVGPAACGECHTSQAETQPATPMAHALVTAMPEILGARSQARFQTGPYTYEVSRQESGATYSIRDPARALAVPLRWVFGLGKIGQTYVLERNGEFYESRVSFFSALNALDFTVGHARSVPASLEEGFGKFVHPLEAKHCFGCHSTASVIDNQLRLAELVPGVTCEACHGPGARHVAAMKAGKLEAKAIFNPARLNPVDSVDFCGACHRTWWDVKLMDSVGRINVRFQPYRLQNSRCWKESRGDARLACVSCHDPHEELQRDDAVYDSKCLACHNGAARSNVAAKPVARKCPTATRDCVKCHMPKVEPPEAHFQFADHWIRVVRLGEGYPN